MILYNSNYFGLPQLTTVSGSAVYRTILPSLFSTCIIFIYKYSFGHGYSANEIKADTGEAIYTVHPFVITIYIMAFSLIINHRLNYCYQRYWESCSSIFMMTSKWMDSATTLAAFHYQSKVYEEDRPRTFGDEDKPFDQLKERDKKKSAPTGGNNRIAMENFNGGLSMDKHMYSRKPDDDDRNHNDDNGLASNKTAISSSGTYDSDSSSDHIITASTPVEFSSSASRRSFVSISSRERHRRYSEAENLTRTIKQFSSKASARDLCGSEGRSKDPRNALRKIFSWKNLRKEQHEIKLHVSDSNAVESSKRKNCTNEASTGSLILNLNSTGNVEKHEYQSTRPRKGVSNAISGIPRAGLSRKSSSMPKIKTRPREDSSLFTAGHSKSIGHGINKAQSERHYAKNSTRLTSEIDGNRHRRLPSTDIPVSGPGGNVVKSFKPNPSLEWQKHNLTAIPRNTGLHPTVIQAPFGFDFEKLLLKEEKERQDEARKKILEARKKILEDLKHRKYEIRNEIGGARAGEAFFVAVRRHTSLLSIKNLKMPSLRSFGDSSRSSSRMGKDDQTRNDVSAPTKSIDDGNDIRISGRKTRPVDNVKPSHITAPLELVDLPPINKKHPVVKSDVSFGSSTLSKKSELEFGSKSVPLQFSNTTNTYENEQAPFLPRSPAQSMNGRASLFLQEAAHLYSLMSATAMASLRADMEGVSSPMVDYVPGQKFPPVNPEEMQIKILVSSEFQSDAKSAPCDHDSNDEVNAQNDRIGSEIQTGESFRINSHNVRIKRNNKYSNIIMFLFGMSRNSRQRTIYNASRPFCVLGGISDAEVEMLRKVRGPSAQHALCSLWLREFITREHLDGSTGGVAPPIVARVYQYISDGTQQYNNCRKTAFTDFPFPHAQLTSFFGFVSIFIFPLLYYTYINNIHIALILNFFTVSCFIGIQEVALELEEPFIRYPNDLPLNNYQAQFNEALISSLYGGFHPDAWGNFGVNDGIFNRSNDIDVNSMSDDSQIQNHSAAPSRMSSLSHSEGNNSISVDSLGRIETKRKISFGSSFISSNTDSHFKSSINSSSSWNRIAKTNNSKRSNQKSMAHYTIPEDNEL